MKLIRGNKLSDDLRKIVLQSFSDRHTNENKTRELHQLGSLKAPTMPYVSDEQWLKDHAFYVTNDGRLSIRHKHCEPHYMAA